MQIRFSSLLTFVAVTLAVTTSASAEVQFKPLTFDQAKKLAAKEHKKVMVDYYTDWCSWCKVLDAKTYTDPAVSKIADAKFISIKVNAEKGDGVALARSNKVSGYPTIVFYTSEGKEIERVVGYQDADHFSRSLNMASVGGTNGLLADLKKNKNLKDASKWLIAADFYAEHQQAKDAISAFQNVIKNDPDNKQKLREEAEYGVAFLTDGNAQWDLLQHALMQYPKRDESRQAVMLLLKHNFEGPNPNEALHLIDIYATQHPDDANTFNYFAWTAAEKGVALDKASEYAERAIALATDQTSRAEAMDTKAEIASKSGRIDDAAMIEQQALDMLQENKTTKLYKDLTAQLEKFKAAAAASGASPGISVPQNH